MADSADEEPVHMHSGARAFDTEAGENISVGRRKSKWGDLFDKLFKLAVIVILIVLIVMVNNLVKNGKDMDEELDSISGIIKDGPQAPVDESNKLLDINCGTEKFFSSETKKCEDCSPCGSGTSQVQDCMQFSDRVCNLCPVGTFADQNNVCEPCGNGCPYCEFSPRDGLVCLPCFPGHYYAPGNLGVMGHCRVCTTSCPPGEQMLSPCTNDADARCGLPSLFLTDEFDSQTWDDVVRKARGGTVRFWSWNGSANINKYILNFIVPNLKAMYDIDLVFDSTVNNGAPEAVQQMLAEKEAGLIHNSDVDMIWINGNNFKNAADNDLLFGPFATSLPSSALYDFNANSIAFDFGHPTDGYEMPYNVAQSTFHYNSELYTGIVPSTMQELVTVACQHPGKFLYSQPSDFTGSVFLRHMFKDYVGYQEFEGAVLNEELYTAEVGRLWEALITLEPCLYKIDGQTVSYPSDHNDIRDLYASGEIWFDLSYDPNHAALNVATGIYPNATRTFLLETGTISNTNFLAIAKASPNKPAALVAIDYIASIEAVYNRSHPDVWGSLPALNFRSSAISPEQHLAFDQLPRSPITPSLEDLLDKRVGELSVAYKDRINADWYARFSA